MGTTQNWFVDHVHKALGKAEGAFSKPPRRAISVGTDLNSALSRALELAQSAQNENAIDRPETVRTIHHLSCMGGTLITKCVASMANTLVLNEIDFQSPIPTRKTTANFAPTDAVSLLRQGDTDVSTAVISKLFTDTVATLLGEERKCGRNLVLRDHSHGHFLWGPSVRAGPTLRDLLHDRFEVKSVVTIRDPVDSYVSMVKAGWHTHFHPSTFDEYCRRYLKFLESYRGVPVIKYEAFAARPKQVMRRMCRLLDLEYFADFKEVFDSFQFSGDSGRSSAVIATRKRAAEAENLRIEARSSNYYKTVIELTKYDAL